MSNQAKDQLVTGSTPYGSSPIEHVWQSIRLKQGLADYDRDYFRSWAKRFRADSRVTEIHSLEYPAFIPLVQSDLGFVQDHEQAAIFRQQICLAYGIPPDMLSSPG